MFNTKGFSHRHNHNCNFSFKYMEIIWNRQNTYKQSSPSVSTGLMVWEDEDNISHNHEVAGEDDDPLLGLQWNHLLDLAHWIAD